MIGLGFWRVLLCTLGVCTLGFGSLNHGIWPLLRVIIWDPESRGTKIKGTNLKSLSLCCSRTVSSKLGLPEYITFCTARCCSVR